MARDRAAVLKDLLKSEKTISNLTRRLDAEEAHFRALSAELQSKVPAFDLPAEQTATNKRRTPEANMIDSVSRIVHRCRAAKITAEQAKEVAMLQLSTLAREKYELAAIPPIVQDRLSYEVAHLWGTGSHLQ